MCTDVNIQAEVEVSSSLRFLKAIKRMKKLIHNKMCHRPHVTMLKFAVKKDQTIEKKPTKTLIKNLSIEIFFSSFDEYN